MKKTLLKTMILLCALVVGGSAWAEDELVYTLTPASGSNNGYAGSCDIEIGGITWNLTGNSQISPWRIGGKSITNTNRALYSKTTISDDISKIEVKHGAASGITVNSWTVIVSKNSDFSNPVSTLTPTFAASATTTINRPNGADWSNCYFKFVYNVTVSGSSNKFLEFTEAKFYKETFSYDITAQSNNNSWGTVSLSGKTITATPATGYRVSTTTPYTVSPEGSATVTQDGNTFTVSPSANTTVTINFEAIPTHTVSFSVNGTTTSTATVAEGAAITFPSAPADVNGMTFVGWYTSTYDNSSVAPEFVTSATMGSSDVTYYAVFANAEDTGTAVQTLAQTLQYDTWTYSGTTKDMNTYRMFAENSYVESASFNLSKLSKVIVYAGTYGSLAAAKKLVTVTAGETVWGSANLTTNKETTQNIITSNISLSGNGSLHVVAGGGDGDSNGIRISKVEIFINEPVIEYSNYCTTVPEPAITLSTNSVEATAAGAEGTINVTYTAIDFTNDPEVVWYTDATATTTANEPSWLAVDINSNGLEYIIDSNEGAARTAYLKVYALDVNGEDVYSELITVTQAAFTQAITPAYTMTTYVTPYKMDFTGVDGLKAYVATDADADGVTVTEVTAAVPENTPLLLKGTAGTTYNVPVAASATAPATNKLRAGDGTTVFDGSTYDYLLYSDGKFYQIGSGTIATNKAYLHLESDPAGARALDIIFDGAEASSISDAVKSVEKNEGYFDLQGRRVAQPTKGLYIVNGKKVIVK